MVRDIDKKILNALKRAEMVGMKQVSVDAISLSSGVAPNKVHKKLRSLNKFNKVRVAQKKNVKKWSLV